MMHTVKGEASPQGYIEAVEGVFRKTLVHGERTLMTEFKLLANHTLPNHSHPHEQTGYLVKGHIVLTVDGTPYDMLPGDSWAILPGIEHSDRGGFGGDRGVFSRTGGLSAIGGISVEV
jgi:quercetin dioxygenase-like cupin family protein